MVILSRRQFVQASLLGLAMPYLAWAAEAQAPFYCPILMYHNIAEPPADANAVMIDLCVSPPTFEDHLRLIQDLGYTSISLRLLADALDGLASLPERPIALSFDDGFINAMTAAESLGRFGMVGNFYLISQELGNPNYLTWDLALQLQNAGHEIGNHSATHRSLRGLAAADLAAETAASAARFAEVLGQTPATFCYPFGHHDRAARVAVKQSGHRLALSTSDGTLHSPERRYQLPRVRVRRSTDASSLAWAIDRRV